MLRFTQHLCVLCLFLSLTHYNYDCNAKNHSGSIKNRYFHELTDVKYVESLNSMKNLFDNNIYANLKLSDSNTSCAEDIITILLGVYQRERWALQWLDATTHPPPGIEGGAMHWTGSYDGCLKCSGGGGGGKMKFHGSYCTMVFNVTTTIKIIPELRMSFGLCMPDSCTSEEVRNMINKVAVSHPSIKMNTKESFCHRYVSEVPKDTWYYVAVSICSIITILVVIATSIDMLLYIKWYHIRLSNRRITGTNHQSERSSFENMNHIEEQTRPLLESDDITYTDHEGEIVDHTEEKHFKTFYQYRKSVLEKHILVKITCAYSLPANTMKLCSQTMGHDQSNKTTPISLTFLDGIRFVSMIWIIGAHILMHGYKLTNNLLILSDDFERIWLFGMYFNGHLAPDIFFFISGLLMCYICMGRLSNLIGVKNHIKFWFKAIVHRFVRLTPAYIVTVIVFTGLLIHMYDGPFFPQDINSPEIASCRQNWYLLYLSNIFNYQTSCLQWSWYIANDLQYTIILAPIFIILLRWKRITGIIFAIAIILMSIFITYYTAYTLSLQITNVDKNEIYVKPYTRCGAYMIGMLTGWLLYEYPRFAVRNTPRNQLIFGLIGYLFSASLIILPIFVSYSVLSGLITETSRGLAAGYLAFHRLSFTLGIAISVYFCAIGWGKPIHYVFSRSAFRVPARLTYCAYLMHPIIVTIFINGTQTPLIIDQLEVVRNLKIQLMFEREEDHWKIRETLLRLIKIYTSVFIYFKVSRSNSNSRTE